MNNDYWKVSKVKVARERRDATTPKEVRQGKLNEMIDSIGNYKPELNVTEDELRLERWDWSFCPGTFN